MSSKRETMSKKVEEAAGVKKVESCRRSKG